MNLDIDLICVYRKYTQGMSEIIAGDTCGTFIFFSKMLTTQSSMSNTFLELTSFDKEKC